VLSTNLEQKCSRAGCILDAKHLIHWRNPKIHTLDRIKIWSACDEHREYLVEYLAARDFYIEDIPFETEHT
jgi:alpha-D-ribose 1-methylphosphonate 5-phosphate C-P lyase